MNENIKNLMGIAIVIGVLAFGYALVSYVGVIAKNSEPTSYRSFSVTGEAKKVTVPDVAEFIFSVVTEGGKDLTALQTENTKKVNKAIAYVKSKGVDAKDIQTQNYSVQPRYQYFDCSRPLITSETVKPCPPPEIVGYTVTQSVLVKARDFTKVGDILSGVVTSGANTVSELSFTIDDPSKVQADARAQAIVKAKEKAEQVAKAGGFTVGRLIEISEGGYQPYANYYNRSDLKAMAVSESAAVPVPAIEPGSQDVTITVTLRYEIQ